MPNPNSEYARSDSESVLERWGVKYFHRLSGKLNKQRENKALDASLFDDSIRHFLSVLITDYAAIIAFCIGAATTIPTVLVEWFYFDSLDFYAYIFLQIGVALLSLIIELTLLFWLGLKTVHSIACLSHSQPSESDPLLPGNDTVANLLARAALELPDPVIRYLGIDPLKYVSKPKLLIIGLLYKAKVILTSVAVKFLLTRMGGKLGLRSSFSWIAIPITGIWDAIVIYKVVREARLRIFGHSLVQYISQEVLTQQVMDKLSTQAQEGAIRAIATMMVMTQNHHPNMLMLIYRFNSCFNLDQQGDYDDWPLFLALLGQLPDEERFFLLDLLCLAAAFDGHLSKMEKQELPKAFGDYTAIYMKRIEYLKNHLLNGELVAAQSLCQLNFRPDIQ